MALHKRLALDSLDGLAPDAGRLNGDNHASPARRAHLMGVMARRAVASLLGPTASAKRSKAMR
jgi:carbon-monoxide dehydrogenase medium subunit